MSTKLRNHFLFLLFLFNLFKVKLNLFYIVYFISARYYTGNYFQAIFLFKQNKPFDYYEKKNVNKMISFTP